MTQSEKRNTLRKIIMDELLECMTSDKPLATLPMPRLSAALQALALDQIASSGDLGDISTALNTFTKEFGSSLTHLIGQLRYVGANAR